MKQKNLVDTMDLKRTPWRYTLVVMIVSYIWQIIIYYKGGLDSVLIPLLMFIPGIVAMIFRIKTKEGLRNVGWGLRKWWYVIPAIFTPIIVVLGTTILLVTMNVATLPDKFFIFKDGMVEITRIGLILGNHTQGISFFIFNFVFSHIVFLLIGSIITLGEEFGWRGYLQEKLLRKYGLNWGFILLGGVWGFWHLPIVLMGWTFPNHPILGAFLLMPISTVFFGIFEGWLYLRSGSIWMPALAHASINLFSGFLFMMNMSQDVLFAKSMFLIGWGVVAVYCLVSLNRNKPVFWQEICLEDNIAHTCSTKKRINY
jgi:membrane protease YdiL (CAAX protease family)